MTNDVDDFLAHYGIAGMKWGRRKVSARQKALQPAKNKGAAVGAVAGLVGASAFVSGGSRLLRNKTFNRMMVESTVNRRMSKLGVEDSLIRALVTDKVGTDIVSGNFTVADMLTKPKNIAKIAIGAAAVSSIVGSTVAVSVKQKRDRDRQIADRQLN